MNATTTMGAHQHRWGAMREVDRESRFRRARRHSRLVRFLRAAIPVFVVLGIGGISLVQYLDPLQMLSRLPKAKKLGVTGTTITMDLPRLSGFTRDRRAYELTAAAAAQDLARPHFMALQEIKANFELEDRSLVNVSAETGDFDSRSEQLTLKEKVRITSSVGTEVRMRQAQFDLRSGVVTSNEPVEIHMPQARLDARQLEVRDGGDIMNFRGGVRLRIDGDAAVASASTPR
ncbi:MAG: lipopolysaccharide export system protein LptC [Variibacter sp.]|jgi:lipopolysaccharide export system protein LptC|nr:lipopolysaccharide export system protein LptC [Variibacter sp.]